MCESASAAPLRQWKCQKRQEAESEYMKNTKMKGRSRAAARAKSLQTYFNHM